ncbi:50S ribosomal protein L25 [Sodalis-like secondary symbiont of Drepanosiphum platanoidis]|uniref:50S ribosomal protein L25 n=1 Tax=Sodalis-like secondary symbiont of Drepanosiphum platanoidis TaxID=2994493 RepID=UPI003464B7A7
MIIINAKIRKDIGKSSNKRLRLLNQIPAIIYGKNIKPLKIKFCYNIISNNKYKNDFYKNFFIIKINKKEIKVKIHSIQYHPFKDKIIHFDFIYI